MKDGSRVTIDRSGRIVDHDGGIEIASAHLDMRVEKRGGLHVAVPVEPVEPLTDEVVRRTQLAVRGRRKAW